MKSDDKKFLHMSIPIGMHKALRVKAAKEGVTMTNLIKAIVLEYLGKCKEKR